MPFFAISNQFLNNLYSSYYKRIMILDKFASFVLPFQDKLYYIVMSLARFNLYANSYVFLAKRAFAGKRDRGGKWTFWLEVFCLILFWNWYIPVLKGTGSWKNALAYLFITNMVPSPLHVQVLLCVSWCNTKSRLTHDCRSSSPTSPARQRILDPKNRSLIASFGRQQMSSARTPSPFYMEGSTSKSPTICFRAYLDTTYGPPVYSSRNMQKNRASSMRSLVSSREMGRSLGF